MNPLEYVATIAPTIGKALTNPAGFAGELAIRAIQKVFDVSSSEIPGVLEQATENPEVRARILEAERLLKAEVMEHTRALRSLDIEEYKIQTAELANVRKMIMATHDRTSERLAYLAWGGLMIVTGILLWMGIPTDPTAVAIVTTIINQAFSLAKDSFAVFTGASPPSQSQPGKDHQNGR
ncbi:MAG: hypothetical protein HQL80_06575 [Magnetococcales bacterium]|nr:hypothetical protein [Magnetococcales bacterium]